MTDDMTTKAFHTIYIHLTAVLIMMSGCCTSLYAKDKTNILDYTCLLYTSDAADER